MKAAFDTFMRGVCGEGYRKIIEGRLGTTGFENAIREPAFFFRDEVRAMLESEFDFVRATKVRQPLLCIEGGEQPKRLVLMSHQISEGTKQLLPQTQVVIIPRVNHALPLEDPETVAKTIASFVSGCAR